MKKEKNQQVQRPSRSPFHPLFRIDLSGMDERSALTLIRALREEGLRLNSEGQVLPVQ